MRNIKLTLAYDGTDFHGWQMQPGFRTVQETLQLGIMKITGEPRIRCNASGRTDTGVHARGQVCNFYTESRLEPHRLLRAINAHLPEDVRVREANEVPQAFDANRDAIRKRYRYTLCDGIVPDLFTRRYAYHSPHRLDESAMRAAAEPLLGRHDFHSFETEWPNRMSSVRTIHDLTIARHEEQIWLEVEADGFLYNMVRAIAGTLIQVGRGYWPTSKVAEVLLAEDRREAGPTAPALGLCLLQVTYPPLGIPCENTAPGLD